MAFKIFLVYPNYRGMNMLPPAVGLISAILKREGHEVQLFDTTYYTKVDGEERNDSDDSKTERLMSRPYALAKEVELTLKSTDVYEDFIAALDDFSPDLIALSVTEDMWRAGHRLLKYARDRGRKITTIAGGVFPTFAPQLVLDHPEVDIVCKGEGEDAIVELCRRMKAGQSYEDIPNLWVKRDDGSVKINDTKMVDMDKLPRIDMSIFEEARFYRPMGGRMWRMFPVETHRGCPYLCAFCNSPSQMKLYRDQTGDSYLRRKSFENMRRELLFYKNEMKAEYLYFWADTFFSWGPKEFDTFAELYEEIGLPFWCQTRVETINFDRFTTLKKMGCARISFGIEHGDEEFRWRQLRRKVKNQLMIDKFKIVNKVGIPYSVNNIMGFPHETRELAMQTVHLNRNIEATDRNAYPFTPFSGTPLRKVCEDLGLIKRTDIVRSMVAEGAVMDMPQFPRKEVMGMIKCFNMYVNFDESRWDEIRKAEEDTPEARELFANLKDEFVDRFWQGDPSESFEGAAS